MDRITSYNVCYTKLLRKGSAQRFYTKYSVYNQLANAYYSILLTQKSLEIQSQNYKVMLAPSIVISATGPSGAGTIRFISRNNFV